MHRPPRPTALLLTTLVVASFLVATTPAGATELLNDGFESGTLSQWSSTKNFTAQQAIVRTGAWAGRATGSAQPAFAQATLGTPTADIYLRAFVDVESHSASVPVLRTRTATGSVLASLNVAADEELVLKNTVTGSTEHSGITVPGGTFVELQLHVFVAGSSGMAEVWFNGTRVDALSGTQNFGSNPVGRLLLGRHDDTSSSMDLVFDDVVIATTFVTDDPPTEPPPVPTGLHTTTVTSDEVGLAWDAAAGATGYTIYRDGVLLATSGAPSYTDDTVQPETTYDYTVDAFNGAGSSDQSPPLEVTTPEASGSGGSVVMASGDIACDPNDGSYNNGNGTSSKCRQKWTAPLLAGADRVLALGDTQYNCAGLSAFNQVYDPTWGQYKSITHPILSDEDYDTSGTNCGSAGPDGYFAYWGSRAGPQPGGYYSFDFAGWHFVALNSECGDVPGGCGEGSAQNNWLEQDLAASNAPCTIAMLHVPRFASKNAGGTVNSAMLPFWQDLYDARAEIVLSGDSHFYERFAPQNPSGNATSSGIVQWIVGVGGKSHGGLAGTRRPNSVKANATTFGVLELTLHSSSYDWSYIAEGGSSFSDDGTASCRA